MAYIYKITNDINDKIYIGKTEFSIQKRFQEHCKDALKTDSTNRPLYNAMKKYGVEHFFIELVEETDVPEEREIYWIEYYQSFKTGYNATMGGDGKKYIDYALVLATYRELQNITETAKKLGIDRGHVGHILAELNISIKGQNIINQEKYGKPVNQYSLQGEYIQTFPSAKNAAISLGKIKNAKDRGAASHISDVCRGKRKTAYGFIWKYSDLN